MLQVKLNFSHISLFGGRNNNYITLTNQLLMDKNYCFLNILDFLIQKSTGKSG